MTNRDWSKLTKLITKPASAILAMAILEEYIFSEADLYKAYFLINHYRPFKDVGADAWDLHEKIKNAILELEPWRDVK